MKTPESQNHTYDRAFAASRLRAIAAEIENKKPLVDIAQYFSIPIPVLHRVVARRHREHPERISYVDEKQRYKIIQLLKDGKTFPEVSQMLNISVSSLKNFAHRNGVHAKKLRNPLLEKNLAKAVSMFASKDAKVNDILKETGITSTMLYRELNRLGIQYRRVFNKSKNKKP